MRTKFFCLTTVVTSIFPTALAWGAAGHEIVATIAQMYLHPTVLPNICNILDYTSTNPDEPQCHLAPVSTWADRFKYKMRWSAALHYVGSPDDYPSETCAFPGDHGWAGKKGDNLLSAIRNVTTILDNWEIVNEALSNEALKFLVHFYGDLHMPLHLTGRDRGGNSVKVRFDNRQTNLHSLWDGLLIAKAIRTVPRNYSRPLPYPEVEFVLRDTIYDSYIRRILWEGVFQKWKGEIQSWLSCPGPEAKEPMSRWQQVLFKVNGLLGRTAEEAIDDEITCPYHWAKPLHALNCDIVWPAALDEPPYNHADGRPRPVYLELDTPAYSGVIAKDMVIEKLLAQAGIRLAGTLNWLFADDNASSSLKPRGLRLYNL